MDILIILEMLGGLVLFLYGIQVMGDGLKKVSGGKLEGILAKLTSNKIKAVLLGALVTAVIQSSGATIVMVVGFVNSQIMSLSQAVGVILGANVGTTITAWLLSLTGITSDNVIIQLFKPAYFSPIVGLIGLIMVMLGKSERRKDVGGILVAFAVLMLGMSAMSSATSPLAEDEAFISILTLFQNPLLGVLAGLVMTAILQSSSASIGILQALSMSGTLTIGTAIPILMGENIGSAITGVLSSVAGSRNAKRAAMMQMYFCIIKTFTFMIIFYAANAIVNFAFMDDLATPVLIAAFHTIFNLTAVIIMLPFSEVLVKLVENTIPTTLQEQEEAESKKTLQILDTRYLASPAFGLQQCKTATVQMAKMAKKAMMNAMDLILEYDEKKVETVSKLEIQVDEYEDQLNAYLVELGGKSLSAKDSRDLSLLLHSINDFERITDHALNIMQISSEMAEKKQKFSSKAEEELLVFTGAVREILDITVKFFAEDDMILAKEVEPLEEVIDGLNMEIKKRHVKRLRKGKCTIDLGIPLSDLTVDLERVADHCSNIAVYSLGAEDENFDTHEYLERAKKADEKEFQMRVEKYEKKYALPKKKKEDD